MTARERFLAVMRGGPVDRPPLWEEGIQEETLSAWRAQGYDGPGLEDPEAVARHFRFDRRDMAEIDFYPRPGGDAGDLERLAGRYLPSPERLPRDWPARTRKWAARDYPLGMTVSRGLLQSLGAGDWTTLTHALYALADTPAAVERIMGSLADMVEAMLAETRSAVDLDFILFSEPIASFHGPVVSPAHYRRFCLPAYRRMADAARAAGVHAIVVSTYGAVEPLIPVWLDLGVDALWCHHAAAAAMDYHALRQRFGPELRLIGAIDSRALLATREGIDQAVSAVAPLLEGGGFLPLLDDRVRSHVPYDAYCYYRQRLVELVGAEQV